MTDESEIWVSITDTAARYGLNYHRLYQMYRRGKVLGRRLSSGQVQVSLRSLEDYLPRPGWMFLQDAVRRYGVSADLILLRIRKGQVRTQRKGLRWQIEVDSLERALKAREIPAGWVTTKEAARRLQVSVTAVQGRIRAGQLRACRQGHRLLVEEAELEKFAIPPGWLTTRQAAEKAGVGISAILRWIRKGQVQARRVQRRWIIQEESCPEKPALPAGWMWLRAVPAVYPLSYRAAYKLARKGLVNARKAGWRWQVEMASFEVAIETRATARRAR